MSTAYRDNEDEYGKKFTLLFEEAAKFYAQVIIANQMVDLPICRIGYLNTLRKHLRDAIENYRLGRSLVANAYLNMVLIEKDNAKWLKLLGPLLRK